MTESPHEERAPGHYGDAARCDYATCLPAIRDPGAAARFGNQSRNLCGAIPFFRELRPIGHGEYAGCHRGARGLRSLPAVDAGCAKAAIGQTWGVYVYGNGKMGTPVWYGAENSYFLGFFRAQIEGDT